MTTGRVWGVTMMRDEADVAGHVLRHMAEEGLDGIIVADNLSTDGTAEILHEVAWDLSGRGTQVVVQVDAEPAYYQSNKMTALAEQAFERGAEWIVPFDADELWYARGDRLAVELRGYRPDVQVVEASLYNHFCTALDGQTVTFEDGCRLDNPFTSMQWRQRQPAALPKVAIRWQSGYRVAQGNHAVEGPTVFGVSVVGIRHFPYRSEEQFVRKARNGADAYARTTLSESEGAHWRQYGALLERYGESALCDVFREHFWYLAPVEGGLVHDPAPFRRWTSA